MQKHTVLIIDDHPLIAEVYENALLNIAAKNNTHEFAITIVNTCDKAIECIRKGTTIDLIFLDINLPKSTDEQFLSGEDLGIEIRKLLPETKIIVATTYNDNYRIHNILKSINPDGFLIKNDINRKDLITAIEAVLEGTPSFSKTVLNILRAHINHDIFVDKIDRDILHQLSIGTKMIDLPTVIPLSKGGIESRKRRLKEIFNIENENDKALVQLAKEKGFI
ncbi:MAG: response regulator transcription factor [Flavobacteriaceae bacterium]|nr:response regulator transcription factor [Flavobacteriaceae bacterium]